MEKGILDTVGSEIVGIVTPVSICMFLVVLLVHVLNPHGDQAPVSNIAMMVYNEQPSDSFSEKLGGALLNALVFVVIVTVVTFMLVVLFYYRCTKCLRVYMGISAFTVLAWMGGIVAVQLIQLYSIPVDVITFTICTINFASVGVAAVFFCRMPIVVTQGYLIFIGMLVAFWFTKLPEWTTWVLLLAMAAYDVVAVLTPGGPLNMLVEMAIARDEDIPALIYEARPNVSSTARIPPTQAQMTSSAADGPRPRRWNRRRASQTTNASNEPSPTTEPEGSSRSPNNQQTLNLATTGAGDSHNNLITQPPMAPEVGILGSRLVSATGDAGALNAAATILSDDRPHLDDDRVPLVQRHSQISSGNSTSLERLEAGQELPATAAVRNSELAEDDEEGIGLGLSGAIKLGLGDFVFYSVLVGRAAMYDLMTVYACYLAIVAGLAATLILLAVWRRALPALPISISLGVLFYFLARLLMDPFVLDMSTNLVYF